MSNSHISKKPKVEEPVKEEEEERHSHISKKPKAEEPVKEEEEERHSHISKKPKAEEPVKEEEEERHSHISKKPKAEEPVKEEEEERLESMEEDSEDVEEDAQSFKYLTEEVRECFKAQGLCESLLEQGLAAMDKDKAKAIEKRWKQHYQSELKMKVKRCELEKEVLDVLHAAHKGMK